jgi:hypothetical protein
MYTLFGVVRNAIQRFNLAKRLAECNAETTGGVGVDQIQHENLLLFAVMPGGRL